MSRYEATQRVLEILEQCVAGGKRALVGSSQPRIQCSRSRSEVNPSSRLPGPAHPPEAGPSGTEPRREPRAAERTRAPRQVIASTLAENAELLAEVTVQMLRQAAQGDTKAATWVLRAFPEGFGRVGEADAGQVEEDERLPTLEEIRLLRAALDATDAEEAARSSEATEN